MADCGISVDTVMAEAVRRRDELNTFIRLLRNRMEGRDLVNDADVQPKGQPRKRQHSV
jgi:hypothetical protein